MYKNALITGGAGFIGSHIAEKLLAKGINVTILDNLSTGSTDNIPKNVKFINGDILDPETINKSLKDIDIVFHDAAKVSIRNSVNHFFDDAKTNLSGTLNILKAFKDSGVKKLIYASSMAVYGEAKYTPIDEKHPVEPNSPYGISKLAAEKYCLNICKNLNIDAIALRYFNTYGIKQTFTPYVGVITIFITQLLNNQPITIFGDGNQVRDFVCVKDVADANILAMESDLKSEIINIGTGKGLSVNSMADILLELMGKGKELKKYGPAQIGEPGSSIADISLANKLLNFKPKIQIYQELPLVINWIKNVKRNSTNAS